MSNCLTKTTFSIIFSTLLFQRPISSPWWVITSQEMIEKLEADLHLDMSSKSFAPFVGLLNCKEDELNLVTIPSLSLRSINYQGWI